MMRAVEWSWCAALLVLTATASWAQSARPRETGRIDSALLMRDVEALSAPEMEGRLTGTPGNKRAQAYIAAQFKEIGLEPLSGAFEQKFSFKQTARGAVKEFPDATNLVGGGARNGGARSLRPRLGSLRSSRRPQRPGLSRRRRQCLGRRRRCSRSARWLRAHPPRQSLLFVAFDGEEEGLQGARHFVEQPPVPLDRISTVVNMDMVGARRQERPVRRGHASLSGAEAARRGRGQGAADHRHASATISPACRRATTGRSRPITVRSTPPMCRSSTSASRITPTTTSPSDTADKIPRAFYAEAVEMVLSTVQRLADASGAAAAAAPARHSEEER